MIAVGVKYAKRAMFELCFSSSVAILHSVASVKMNGTLPKVLLGQRTTLQGGVIGKNHNFNGVKLCVKSFLAPLGRYLQDLITVREWESPTGDYSTDQPCRVQKLGYRKQL